MNKDIEQELNTVEVKSAMLNVVNKLNDLLNDDNRDEIKTRQEVSISTAMTSAAKTYLNGIALEVKVKELHDKGI